MAGTNPRAARIAALIQRVVASSIERELHDKRLASITVTEVRVTNDLQIAKVYWTQLGHEGHEEGERKRAQQALDQAKGHLRSLVGHKAGPVSYTHLEQYPATSIQVRGAARPVAYCSNNGVPSAGWVA